MWELKSFQTGQYSLLPYVGQEMTICGSRKLESQAYRAVLFAWVQPPFPQIDIIGDVVTVWRVRGKTIRSVLCNIVCNNCAQCDAHTQTNSSLDWVLSHWAHFTVLDSFLANVNSRSRSLYAIARPSVVCNVRAPYLGGSDFRQYFYGIRYLGHPWTSTENFTEIVPGEPLRRGS